MSTSPLNQIVFFDPLPGSLRHSPHAEFPIPTLPPQPMEISHWHCTSYILNGGYWPPLSSQPELLSQMQETTRQITHVRFCLKEDARLFSEAELAEIEATVESIAKSLELSPKLDAIKKLSFEARKLAKRMTARSIKAWLSSLDLADVTSDMLFEETNFV